MLDARGGLRDIGFKPNEIKAYLALTRLGEATAAQVAKRADLPRTTVISILGKLSGEGYLTTHRYRGVTYYWVESPRTLMHALATKMEVAERLNEALRHLYRSETAGFPVAEVHDTKASIRGYIERVIGSLEKGAVIRTIDAPAIGNYEKVFSENIVSALLKKKSARGIRTRTLIPYGSVAKVDPRKVAAQQIEIRELPEGISYEASLWLIGDTLAYFSGSPPFLVAIRHHAIVAGAASVYEHLWRASKPL